MTVLEQVTQIGKQNTDKLLDEIASSFKKQHRTGWEIAKRVFELSQTYGMTDQVISNKLFERGVSVARSTVNKYRLTYAYYIDRMGLNPAELNIPLSTLASARPFLEDAKVGRDAVNDILNTITGLEQGDALKYIRSYFGVGNDKIKEFGTIKVPREVFEAFDYAHEYMNSAIEAGGYPKLSKTAFLEFLSRLVLDSSADDLRELYKRELGDA